MTSESRCRSGSTARRLAIGAPVLAALAGLSSSGGMSRQAGAQALDEARTALEEWAQTRRLISKLKSDWTIGKELLTQRIELTRHQIEQLREDIAAAEGTIADAEQKRAELAAENEELKEARAAFADGVAGLESRTKELLKRLPEPVLEQIELLSQRIPENPDGTEIELPQRYLSVLGILDAANKFHGAVHVKSEVRTLADRTAAEVTVLYVGLSQAFYVTAGEDAAGVGVPSADGWVWTPAIGSERAIAEAISILNNQAPPAFVPLPIHIE